MDGLLGSPDFVIGVTLEIFHSWGTFIWDRDSLKMVVRVGAIASAVPRSMWLEMPSGPDAVCSLWLTSSLFTSSWEQFTLVRHGVLSVGESSTEALELVEKQEEKNLLSRLAFWVEVEAVNESCLRSGGMRSFFWCKLVIG